MMNFLKKIFNKENNKVLKTQEIKEELKSERRIANITEALSDLSTTYDDNNLQRLYACSVQKTAKDFLIKKFDVNGNVVNVAFDSLDDEFSDNCGKGGNSLQEAINDVFEMQKAGQDIIFTYYAKQGFIGFNNCAILAQDWLIQKAVNAPCEDAISVNYTLNCDDSTIDETEKDLIPKLQKVSDDTDGYNIKKICKKFAENKRKYGQAICIPVIEGIDYSLPFNIDAIAAKSYKGMIVVEPVWVAATLDTESIINPLSKRFYQPTWFRLPNGVMVHHSWVIYNTYGEPADILKPSYFWGGIPLPQLLYEQTYAAHKTAKEAPMLAMSKRLNYVEVNPNALLFDKEKRNELKFMSWLRSNFGWLTIKQDQKIGQLDTTLADFDNVVMLSYQVVSAISGVIATRLLETSPKGWQSSGSYEDKQYKKLLQGIQQNDFSPILDLHYRLLAKSEYGLNKRYTIHFDEIDTPTAKEAAEIREIEARTDSTYIQAGVIAPDEVRTKIREDENSAYSALETDMPDVEPDMFNDGGSSNEQSPFSMDEEPKDWFTSNGAKIPIMNGEGQNEAFKEHTEGSLSKEVQKLLGEEFKGIKGQDAINKIYKEKKGHVKNAFYRDVIGNISVFWGDSKCGLKHIIEHRKNRNIDPKEFIKGLGKVIERGSIDTTRKDSNRWIIKYKGKKAIISKELKNNKFICVLTAFL